MPLKLSPSTQESPSIQQNLQNKNKNPQLLQILFLLLSQDEPHPNHKKNHASQNHTLRTRCRAYEKNVKLIFFLHDLAKATRIIQVLKQTKKKTGITPVYANDNTIQTYTNVKSRIIHIPHITAMETWLNAERQNPGYDHYPNLSLAQLRAEKCN
jgi:mRNA-degrading endonuclease YafQ of YafQ-DinJ toxin-antitoxin module